MPGEAVRRELAQDTERAFRQHVLPALSQAIDRPGEVRAAIDAIRDLCDALELLVGDGDDAEAPVEAAGGSPAPTALSGRPQSAAEPAAGSVLGRNQRSRLREIAMLEALAGEHRAFTLEELSSVLSAQGFSDTSSAIVSQLHRLKKLEIITQPFNGVYEITEAGLSHVRRLKASFAALRRPNGR